MVEHWHDNTLKNVFCTVKSALRRMDELDQFDLFDSPILLHVISQLRGLMPSKQTKGEEGLMIWGYLG